MTNYGFGSFFNDFYGMFNDNTIFGSITYSDDSILENQPENFPSFNISQVMSDIMYQKKLAELDEQEVEYCELVVDKGQMILHYCYITKDHVVDQSYICAKFSG